MVSLPLLRSALTGLLTFLIILPSVAEEHRHLRCGFLTGNERERVTKLGEGIQAGRPRPDLPEFADTPDSLFRVHFTRVGPDAVPPADDNQNGLPDFVDEALTSLTTVWSIQQDYQAPPKPPSDGMAGGSPALDVYLLNLATAGSAGTGYYGLTLPDSLIKDGNTDGWPRFTSWIEADNDFSPSDTNVYGDTVFATFGVEGLRVTCAHEVHHVTQLSVVGDASVQLMLYELMSTYMEIACYPEYQDWLVYASKFFRTPAGYAFGDPGSLNGYVWGWFMRAWQAQTPQIFAGVFDEMIRGERPFQALVQSSIAAAASLDSTFVRTLPSIYGTGPRGADNAVLLNAEDLPEIYWHVNDVAVAPSALSTGNLQPFEVRAFRYSVPPLVGTEPIATSILLTWPNMAAFVATQSPSRKDYTLTLTASPAPSDIPISGSAWGIRIQPSDIALWVNNAATVRPGAPYPQPASASGTSPVYVPILDALPGDVATITLMTVQTLGISTQQEPVTLDEDRIVVPLMIPNNLTPGTYLLRVECNNRTDLHKLSVRR